MKRPLMLGIALLTLISCGVTGANQGGGGALCRSNDLQGRYVGDVPGKLPGCGIEDAVMIEQIGSVSLSTPAVLHCSAARALEKWVEKTAEPQMRREGMTLAELQVVGHYTCRTVNNRPGGRISEHGKGRGVDIAAFVPTEGKPVTVLNGWDDPATSKMLRKMQAGACRVFSTAIGPDGDRYHQDHFHFDTATGRGRGSYCR